MSLQDLPHPPGLRRSRDPRCRIHTRVRTPGVQNGHFLAILRHLEERHTVHLQKLRNASEASLHVRVDTFLWETGERGREVEEKRLKLNPAIQVWLARLSVGHVCRSNNKLPTVIAT